MVIKAEMVCYFTCLVMFILFHLSMYNIDVVVAVCLADVVFYVKRQRG